MKDSKKILVAIVGVAILIRFLWFKESIYFGFDEARDAFVSQGIYRGGDFKLIGPPANAPGLNHGVLHWYLAGLFYLIGGGSPLFVSLVYRIFNALGVILIYLIGKKFFNQKAGLIGCLLYAFSFEQTQYAMYMGNPSLAVFFWMMIFWGGAIILRDKNKFWGLPLMVIGAAAATQLELFLAALFGLLLVLLILLRPKLKDISIKSGLAAGVFGLGLLSSYLMTEFRYGFRGLKAGLGLLSSGYQVIGETETKGSLYLRRFLLMFHDNIAPVGEIWLGIIALLLVSFLLFKAFREVGARLVLVWIFGGLFILLFGAYNAYYINVGIGTGILIGFSVLLEWLLRKNKWGFGLVLLLIIAGNTSQIIKYNRHGLIGDIKTQQYMLLSDQVKVIRKMYQLAEGKGFTVRATSMPYKIPTVWAYLFEHYGQKEFGYLPYWETGSVLGFPGKLPSPVQGSTCIRYWLREPTGGIPERLIVEDEKEEKAFSNLAEEWSIGHFKLQQRQSVDEDCHNEKPVDSPTMSGLLAV